jgi:hypothetical protein
VSAGPERKLAAIMLATSPASARSWSVTRLRRSNVFAPCGSTGDAAGGRARRRVIKTTGDGFLSGISQRYAALQCGIAIQRQKPCPGNWRARRPAHSTFGSASRRRHHHRRQRCRGGWSGHRRAPGAARAVDGICVSATTVREHIRQEPGSNTGLGDQRVKNIRAADRAYKIDLAGEGSVEPAAAPRPPRAVDPRRSRLGRRILRFRRLCRDRSRVQGSPEAGARSRGGSANDVRDTAPDFTPV